MVYFVVFWALSFVAGIVGALWAHGPGPVRIVDCGAVAPLTTATVEFTAKPRPVARRKAYLLAPRPAARAVAVGPATLRCPPSPRVAERMPDVAIVTPAAAPPTDDVDMAADIRAHELWAWASTLPMATDDPRPSADRPDVAAPTAAAVLPVTRADRPADDATGGAAAAALALALAGRAGTWAPPRLLPQHAGPDASGSVAIDRRCQFAWRTAARILAEDAVPRQARYVAEQRGGFGFWDGIPLPARCPLPRDARGRYRATCPVA